MALSVGRGLHVERPSTEIQGQRHGDSQTRTACFRGSRFYHSSVLVPDSDINISAVLSLCFEGKRWETIEGQSTSFHQTHCSAYCEIMGLLRWMRGLNRTSKGNELGQDTAPIGLVGAIITMASMTTMVVVVRLDPMNGYGLSGLRTVQ